MSERVFDGRIAGEIAPDDRARQERLKATARALVSAVRDGLVRDGAVRLHGFGTFRLRPVAARKGRHPRTGEPIDIPAGWRVMFRPAKALRERVEPDQSPSLPIGEPHASREAMLAASAASAARNIRPGAGRIPAEGIAAPMPVEPERAAAAAMSEPKYTLEGPIPSATVDLEADSRVTRSPAALTRAPAANEPSPPEPSATKPSATEPVPAPAAGRRHGYRYALVLLLVLLLAGLAWLSRPLDSPAPRVAEEPDPSVAGGLSGDAGNASPDAAVTADGVAAGEPEAAMALTEPSGSQPGTGESVATVDETAEVASSATADREGAASPDDSSAADTGEAGSASLEPTTGQTATVDDSVHPVDSTPSVGPDAGSPDEVMAALSRAAEASAVTPSETTSAGDVRGEAAAESSAEPGVASADNTTSAGAEPAGDALDQRQVVETPAAGARVTDAAAEGPPWFSGRDYTVRRGDTLWELADRHYVNPYYWPHIWNHNSGIANPDRLEVRQGLWLPSLEGDPQSLTEGDRRSIAEGYLRLYRFFRARGDANPQYALVGVRYFDASVLPERLRGTAAGHPGDTLAAAFRARLEAEFPLD